MQPQAKYADEKSPEDNKRVAAEVVEGRGLEHENKSQANPNSDNSDAREHAVSDDTNSFLVTFSPQDTENPLNWSTKLKWGVTAAVSGTGFNRIMVSTVRHSLCRRRAFYKEGDYTFEAWGFC